MKVELETRWLLNDEPLDDRVPPLLRAIAATGSLAQARTEIHLSYRQAWTLLGAVAHRLGEPLVELQRGKGATLTPLGTELLAADTRARKALHPHHARLARQIESVFAKFSRYPLPVKLNVHASHDLALAALRERLARDKGLVLDLHFHGSLDALDDLLAGKCEIAGFHAPAGRLERNLRSAFATRLLVHELAIVQFATRRQGLMVPRGNPRRIHRLADLTQPGTRFVNRQEGSGTRLLFDALLTESGVQPNQIEGYAAEEFTHAAVAATVASGMADAGFGIEAAAHRQRLAFLPLAVERYYLALRTSTLKHPAARTLLTELRGRAFRASIKQLPGYQAAGAGRRVAVRAVLGKE